MNFSDFERLLSPARLNRYFKAAGESPEKAMSLYRANTKLSSAIFSVISLFEVGLRNVIDFKVKICLGEEWLKDLAKAGSLFDNEDCYQAKEIVEKAVEALGRSYSHSSLITALSFSFWRRLFIQPHYEALLNVGRCNLLRVFPNKPKSSARKQYDRKYVFALLTLINDMRNRIAHHEPICFVAYQPLISTQNARKVYANVVELLAWMGVDAGRFLFGIDDVLSICDEIDRI